MIIAGWLTPAIRTRFNPLMVDVDLPGLPLEWSVRQAASSTAPDMEFKAVVVDTSAPSDVFRVPEVDEQPENADNPGDEDDDDPPAGEARNIETPEIIKIQFLSAPALQSTYCFDGNSQCRLFRKFTREGYLYNIILDAPQKHFEQAARTAEAMLKTLKVSGE